MCHNRKVYSAKYRSECEVGYYSSRSFAIYAQRYTLDLLGLNDEWIAHHVPARGHRPGHTKAAPFRYPIDKKIDLLIYHPSFSKQVHRPFTAYEKSTATIWVRVEKLSGTRSKPSMVERLDEK